MKILLLVIDLLIFFSLFQLFFTRGYYPKGGGEIQVKVKPVKQLKPLQLLERGSLVRITGSAFVAGVLPFKVCRHVIHYCNNTEEVHQTEY